MSKIYDAIIIGSGAASYSAADWLYKENVKNIAIITENRLGGTSRNTGSDKQTYYKLSLDGKTPDSAYKMATDIFSGGCTDGEKIYLQSVNSVRCFLRLFDYGVDFPTDAFGGFPGYKTDHDNTTRATSVGPLTSKIMTEKLENKVLVENRTKLLDNRQVVEIITCNNQAFGVVAFNKTKNDFEIIKAHNVICGTGAPACIYKNSVYPHSQHGMTGVMLNAGVKLCNFTQWQYGMASTDFRWNVSGSFMQVIPRFVSIDENGNEYEFLNDYIENPYDFVFLKGYQWPFNFNRIELSSRVDIAVHSECEKGRKVYLDYTKNPSDFDFDSLCDEARYYLLSNNAKADTPIERLNLLNSKAIDVYKNQGIDLYSDYLQIAVCAQHNNGGVNTDNNYETDVKNLYAIGECAGTFGLARPGGTALNDTQVSSYLCAKHISTKVSQNAPQTAFEVYKSKYESVKNNFILAENTDYSYITEKMSSCAAFLRNKAQCEALLNEVDDILNAYPLKHKSISQYYYDFDMLLSVRALLISIINEMSVTGSRGGAVFVNNGEIVAENTKYREFLTITKGDEITFEKVKSVPVTDIPFEQYLKEN